MAEYLRLPKWEPPTGHLNRSNYHLGFDTIPGFSFKIIIYH